MRARLLLCSFLAAVVLALPLARGAGATVPPGFSAVQIVHEEFTDTVNGCPSGPTFRAAPMMIIDAPDLQQYGGYACVQVDPTPDPFGVSAFYAQPPPFEYLRLAGDLCGAMGTIANYCAGMQVGMVGVPLYTVEGCVTQNANQCAIQNNQRFCGLEATLATLQAAFGGWTYRGREARQDEFDHQACSEPAASIAATLTAEPGDVGVGDQVTVTLHVRNTGTAPVQRIGTTLMVSGEGMLEQQSGPAPATADLAPGAMHDFVYVFDATAPGQATIKGHAQGTGPANETVGADATCGIGGLAAVRAAPRASDPGTCPIGGGVGVQIAGCALDDVSAPLELDRLTGDATPPPGSAGYQHPGGT